MGLNLNFVFGGKFVNVVIGVCGGIAAYKVCELVRLFKKSRHEVSVIMTKNATEFVTPLTFQTLSCNPVSVEMFDKPNEWDIEHISLAKKADILIVAPATANVIGKVAGGIADDLLTTTIMATKAPVVFVPAMNTNMYQNNIFQKNVEYLKTLGYNFIEPDEGELACGDIGKGKFPKVELILEKVVKIMSKKTDLIGRSILVTAGSTREAIDPVRFISNHSSGKMGYSLAEVASARGAKVCVVSGPVSLKPCEKFESINVESAQQMRDAVVEKFKDFDIIIMVAAVADYRVEHPATSKIKKADDTMQIKLVKNPDIAKEVGAMKGKRILVGFCAETNDLVENAQVKIKNKHFDIIVANDVTKPGAGFGTDTNIVTIIDRKGRKESLSLMSKVDVAERIIDYILEFEKETQKID